MQNRYAGLATTTSRGITDAPLTIKDMERAYKSILKADKDHQKWANNLIKSKTWQRASADLRKLLHYLMDLPGRDKDYLIAHMCWMSIQPNTFAPVGTKTKNRCEELLKEMNEK